ncbi:hypothetical protein [Streptomyces sp. GbtcB6]|uniref:hypothetical protein n=1 Tax=Streptomyces sp. GbtcB6 TaxID=2824751 RepID=UPI001C3019A0|nr:hypothetical protein [Streptomyces sp. GbtcB6]
MSLVPVLRALPEMQHLSLGEARRMATDFKEVGLVGTSVEVAYLAEELRNRSLTVTITPGHVPRGGATRSGRAAVNEGLL